MANIKDITTSLEQLVEKLQTKAAGVELPELTNPAIENDVLNGKEFIDENGIKKTGAIPTNTWNNLTTDEATVTVPAGYYADTVTKSIATATQATPSISVSSGGLITASATQGAGYVSAGTKSATKQLTTQAAKTVTPSKSSQTAVASGVYTTGAVTVAAIPSQYEDTTTPLADLNAINGGTAASTISSAVDNTETYVSDQTALIAQIQTALEGKAAGGGASVDTCTVNINTYMQGVGYFTVFEDGHIQTVQQNLVYGVTNTINYAVVDSVMHITVYDGGIGNASTTGGAVVLHRAVNYDNTHYVIKCGNGPICNISIIEDDIVG